MISVSVPMSPFIAKNYKNLRSDILQIFLYMYMYIHKFWHFNTCLISHPSNSVGNWQLPYSKWQHRKKQTFLGCIFIFKKCMFYH